MGFNFQMLVRGIGISLNRYGFGPDMNLAQVWDESYETDRQKLKTKHKVDGRR